MPLLKERLKVEGRATYTFYKYLWNRTHRYNFNTAKVNTGTPGCGKTVSAVTEAYIINSRRFDSSYYVNTAREFLDVVDDSKRGDTLVWDEAGVSLSSRRWQSLSNILTGETLQTYRYNKLTVIFVAPDLGFIDKQARKLMTIFCETKRYDNIDSTNWMYKINVDRKKGDIYFPYFNIRTMGKMVLLPWVKIPRTCIKKVPKEIWKGIREKEIAFKERVRKKSMKMIEILEQEERGGETIFDLINAVEKDPGKYQNVKGDLDVYMIQTHLGVGRCKASQIVKFLRKKAQAVSQTAPARHQ